MSFNVKSETLVGAPINYNEIIRYAGAKTADYNLKSLIDDCVRECETHSAVKFAVCFTETPLLIRENTADFSAFTLTSRNLTHALNGAESALIFACTLGLGIDRLIVKYSEINPARALIMQALGTERIETFTDKFLLGFSRKNGVTLTARFSPGYGDLTLSKQKDLFALLSPQKRIGLTLNESLLMSPSKSVTAIAGIKRCETHNKPTARCRLCNKTDCEYRIK